MTYEQALNINQNWTAEQAFNDLERYLLRGEKPAVKAVAIGMQALKKQIPNKLYGEQFEYPGNIMNDWESPITILQRQIQNQQENAILSAVLECGITVDKDELIKAINYDRNQYRKGFEDGYRRALQDTEESESKEG